MNEVFLSGIIETMPKQVSHVNETLHVRLLLRVSHRTVAGVEKQERYPINAWRATASRLLELAKPGSRMSLKGYLSQHTTANGTFVEVTVDEFCIAANSKPGRTLSNSMPPAESVVQCEATE